MSDMTPPVDKTKYVDFMHGVGGSSALWLYACRICGATVERQMMARHDAWHKPVTGTEYRGGPVNNPPPHAKASDTWWAEDGFHRVMDAAGDWVIVL